MGEHQNVTTQAHRGFVGLQEHPMESSLSRCRRRNHSATSGHYEGVPVPDQGHGCHKPGEANEECMPYSSVQQSNSWPSRNTAEHIPTSNRIPPGISRPPFANTPDKTMMLCRYMKSATADNRGSVPLHHLPSNNAPGAINPMWGPSSASSMFHNPGGPPQNNHSIYPPGSMPPNVRPPPQSMMPLQPPQQQFDILQDAMRQTIDTNSSMSTAMPFPQAPRLGEQTLHSLQNAANDALTRMHPAAFSIPSMPQSLPSVTWQHPINQHSMAKTTDHLNGTQFQNSRNLCTTTMANYSRSNLSVNNYDPNNNSSECEFEDNSQDEKMDFSCDTGENTDDLVIEIDLSKKPETLQEAIAMYIDFLILENDKKTHISECQLLPVRFDFEKEQYYMEVMSKPIPFPTGKFRSWLKLYNVDIEITDPHGNTASQTTFAPSSQCGEAPRPPLPTHMMNWQMMPPDSTVSGTMNKCNQDIGISSVDLSNGHLNIAVTSTGNLTGGLMNRQLVNCHQQQQQQNQQQQLPSQLLQVPPGGALGTTDPPNVRVSVGIQCNDDVEKQILLAYVKQHNGELPQPTQLHNMTDGARNAMPHPVNGHMRHDIARSDGVTPGGSTQLPSYTSQSATCIVEVNSSEVLPGRVKHQEGMYTNMPEGQQQQQQQQQLQQQHAGMGCCRQKLVERSPSDHLQQDAVSTTRMGVEKGSLGGCMIPRPPPPKDSYQSCNVSTVTTSMAVKTTRGTLCRLATTETCEEDMKAVDSDPSSTTQQQVPQQQQLHDQQQLQQQQRWNNAICIVPVSEADKMPDLKTVTSTCPSRPTRITRSSAVVGKQDIAEARKRVLPTEAVMQMAKRTRLSQKQSPTRALP